MFNAAVYIPFSLLHFPTCMLLTLNPPQRFHKLSCGGKSGPPFLFIQDLVWSVGSCERGIETWVFLFPRNTHTHAQKLPSVDGMSRCLSITCQRSCDSPSWKCSKLFNKTTPFLEGLTNFCCMDSDNLQRGHDPNVDAGRVWGCEWMLCSVCVFLHRCTVVDRIYENVSWIWENTFKDALETGC